VEEHQQATQRILTLTETSNALDDHLTSLLTTLSEARLQLLSVPSTKFSAKPREVSYTELLAYASKISKYSRPSNPAAFRKHASAVLPQPPEEGKEKEEPPLGMSEEEFTSLDPSGNLQFTPWPNEILMRQGALQAVGPNGIPEDMVPEAEKKKKEAAEKERLERERAVNGGPNEADEKARRNSYATTQRDRPPAPPPVSLTLDLWEGGGDDD